MTADRNDGGNDGAETAGVPRAAAHPTGASAQALLARLATLGIDAATHDHPPLYTVEDSRALRGDLPGAHCKNLFLKDRKGRLFLVVSLEDRALDLKKLGRQIGAANPSFGKPDLLAEVLGVRPGAVTPFAIINDVTQRVELVLDREMMEDHALLNFHPLINDRTTAIAPKDLMRFVADCGHAPQIVDLSQCLRDPG